MQDFFQFFNIDSENILVHTEYVMEYILQIIRESSSCKVFE